MQGGCWCKELLVQKQVRRMLRKTSECFCLWSKICNLLLIQKQQKKKTLSFPNFSWQMNIPYSHIHDLRQEEMSFLHFSIFPLAFTYNWQINVAMTMLVAVREQPWLSRSIRQTAGLTDCNGYAPGTSDCPFVFLHWPEDFADFTQLQNFQNSHAST